MSTTSKPAAGAASIVDREGAEGDAAQHAAPSSSQASARHSSASPMLSAAVPPERRRPMRRPDLGEQAPHRDCSKPCSGGSPARLCAGRSAVGPVASFVPQPDLRRSRGGLAEHAARSARVYGKCGLHRHRRQMIPAADEFRHSRRRSGRAARLTLTEGPQSFRISA